MSVLFILALLGVALVGFGLVPIATFILRDSIPRPIAEVIALGHLMLTHLHWGGSAIVFRDSRLYHLAPLRVNEDWISVKLDGEWIHIAGSTAQLDRFAFGWFTMLVERGDQIDPITADVSRDAVADGGRDAATLPDVRGGTTDRWQAFSPVLDDNCDAAGDGYGGPIIDLAKATNAIQRTNQEHLTKAGLDYALKEFGGLGQLGPLATVIGVIVCLVFGAVMTWVAMGGI